MSLSQQEGVLSQADQWVANKVPYNSQLLQDCSGFIKQIFGNEGITLPRTSEQQATVGESVPLSEIQPGDVVFYNVPGELENGSYTNNHEALYIGNGETIQETTPGTTASVQPLNSEPISTIQDFFGPSTSAGTTATIEPASATLTNFVQSSGLSGNDAATAHQMFLVILLSLGFIYGLVEVAGTSDELGSASIAIIVGLFILMGYQYYSRGGDVPVQCFSSAYYSCC